MIDSITGIVKELNQGTLILQANNINWLLQVPSNTSWTPEESSQVYIYLHWHSDNGPTLLGFASPLDRTLFSLIINCSGIGPKIGLSLLSSLSSHNIISAIQQKNSLAFSKVSGVGIKKAEQITLQLHSKINKLIKEKNIDLSQENKDWHTITEVLTSLGYKNSEIQKALTFLQTNASKKTDTFDELLQRSLSFLSKNR